jgi:hypothetical protein
MKSIVLETLLPELRNSYSMKQILIIDVNRFDIKNVPVGWLYNLTTMLNRLLAEGGGGSAMTTVRIVYKTPIIMLENDESTPPF